MIKQYWTLDDVPDAHRAHSLTRAISDTFGLCVCGYDLSDSEVSADFTHISLGQLALVNFTGRGTYWCERRLTHLRRDYSDNFLLYLPASSRVTISQKDQRNLFGVDKIGFVNTRHAYRGVLSGEDGRNFNSSHIIVPGALLRSRFPNADSLAGIAVMADESLLDLMTSLIHTISDRKDMASERAYRGLERVLLELVSSASDCALERTSNAGSDRTEVNATLKRVTEYILRNLTDPGLSISGIAGALNMSVRHIHNLFEGTEWTAKSWIKHRRLIECRRTIRSPDMVARTLTEIAYTWAFSDFSHFSRCYKEKFGISPSEDRKLGPLPSGTDEDLLGGYDILASASSRLQ